MPSQFLLQTVHLGPQFIGQLHQLFIFGSELIGLVVQHAYTLQLSHPTLWCCHTITSTLSLNLIETNKKEIINFSVYFLLFPYPKNFWLSGISLSKIGKIGIDEKVICYHNISNLLWKKMFFVFGNKNESQKNYKFSAFQPRICKLFSRFTFFFLTLEQFFLTVR